jgi:spermidine/putrescine transport system substrate-binding protein
VTLPLYDDNRAIASGRRPEAGPLELYNWADYINVDVVKGFERKHGVKVQVTTFTSTDEAVAKLATKAARFDVTVPDPSTIHRLVAGKLIQPLNLDYVPNLKANVWPWLADPWYDRGSRYTVPYTVLSTGIGWRADKLPGFDPARLANPYDAFWQATDIKGKVGLLDDQRHVLAMALLRNGVSDVNTDDPARIAKARDDVLELVRTVNPRFETNDYEKLPAGDVWLHQSWSGALVLAQYFLPKGTPVDVLRYWWPTDGHGIAANDTLAVLRGARNPVLAHLFINHLLDSATAVENFAYTGTQPPVRGAEPDALVKAGLVPPKLRTAVMLESQVRNALPVAPLSLRAATLWQDAWSRIRAA